MTMHLGNVPASSTLYIPFHTFNSSGASVTITGLAVTDIEIYKNGSVTQRASDAGYTLLDTDGIDFDGITGIHGFSIDLSDNSDAGFYAVGSFYWVVVSSITANSQTVNLVAATFRIVTAENTSGLPVADTTKFAGQTITLSGGVTIPAATLASTTNITAGTVTTATNVTTVNGLAAGVITAAAIATDAIDADAIADNAIDAGAIAANAITAAKIANDALDALTFTACIGTGTIGSGSTTTSVVASAIVPTSVVNDQYNGRIIIFDRATTTTALRGQATDITDYVHATLTFTVTALTTAPVSGDTFHIL